MAERRVNGVNLYYEEHGEGEPILCIHGGGSTAMMWTDAISELANLGRVIAYDRRGCTRSERPEPYVSTTVAEQADDAAGLLNELGAGPAIVIARSYGGAVAVELALRYPERVRALALLEGDAFGLSPWGLEWHRAIRDRLREVAKDEGEDAVYRFAVDEFISPGAWDSFPVEVQDLLTDNAAALLADLHYVEEKMPGEAEFATLDVPVLLIAARESPPPQRDMTEAMARALPDGRLEIVDGGHLINPAAPEVVEFIEEVLHAQR